MTLVNSLRARLFHLVAGLLLVLAGAGAPAFAAEGDPVEFIRGDANADGFVSISDAVMIMRWQFQGQIPPTCFEAANADDSDHVDLVDSISIIHALFVVDGWAETWPWYPFVGTVLPEPYPLKGTDPTPTPGMTCNSYEVHEAAATDDVIRIGEVVGSPGQVVEIPVYLTNSLPVQAFQLLIGYDPDEITPLSLDFEGTAYEEHPFSTLDGPPNWLKEQPDHGVFTVGINGCLARFNATVPPGADVPFVKIIAEIADGVPPGTVITLSPTNGPDGQGVGPHRMRNELTCDGAARYASLLPQRVPGRVTIVGDFLDFLRADSNGDGKVDISDPIFTLGFVFLGGRESACPDAADADDNGMIDITDPILTLGHLFQGGGAPQGGTPFSGCDRDFSEDALGPCYRESCAAR